MTQPAKWSLPPTESLVLYLSMFIMGGCGLAYEYTLSKLSSDLLGNSVEQWAIISQRQRLQRSAVCCTIVKQCLLAGTRTRGKA